MAPKRKAPISRESPSIFKRQKTSSEYPCQLCTSTATENVLTIRTTTKGKPAQDLTAHERCMEIIPEVDWKQKRITKGDLPDYRSRFKLKCNVCSESHGAKIQCSVGKCTHAFHINCATLADEILFDTTTETYGLVPWYLLCKRHNAERIRKSASKILPSPTSSARTLSTSPPPSAADSMHDIDEDEGAALPGPPTMSVVIHPETAGSPTRASSSSDACTPPSPASLIQDLPRGSKVVDEAMASVDDEVPEETAVTSTVVLSPEQIKLVADFMLTDPTWDLFMQGILASCLPSNSTLAPAPAVSV